MAKRGKDTALSENIIDAGTKQKLQLRESQLEVMVNALNKKFIALSEALIQNRAILAFMNGRVDPIEFTLAKKVLDTVENEILVLHADIENVSQIRDEITKTLKSITQSFTLENKVVQVENFLSRFSNSQLDSNTPYDYTELKYDAERARLLEHSASALLELKAGK